MASKSKKKTKTAGKSAVSVRPIKQRLTKSALLGMLAEGSNLSRKQVAEVLSHLEAIMMGSVHPSGAGIFMFPGLFKISLRKVPARKAGTLIRNPATGEMMKGAAKPASVRVKIRPLARLKGAAIR
jgi:nucleoid DNA-binding protein